MGPLGLDRRLGDHPRRHHRDGEPGRDRRPSTPSAVRGRRTPNTSGWCWRSAWSGSCHDSSAGSGSSCRHGRRSSSSGWSHRAGPSSRRSRSSRSTRRRGGSVLPSLDWLNPFVIPDSSALAGRHVLAVFIYWGWDTTVTVNEESEDATEGPGKAAIVATLILLVIYLIVSIAAQAVHGHDPDGAANQRRPRGARDRRARPPARQAPDHRGPHLGGRVDPDDDPADGPDARCRWRAKKALPRSGRGSTHVPDARASDDLDGHPLDRLVRRLRS